MTQRIRLDDLTDDQLDTLYREIDTLRAVCQSNKQAYIGAVKDAMAADQRAERAEATLNAVRDELTAIDRDVRGKNPVALAGIRHTSSRIRAVLDQHGQTPS